MTILSKKLQKKEENKFVGGKVPPTIYEYLCLFSITKHKSKSYYLREALQEFRENRPTEDELIDMLTIELANQLEIHKSEGKSTKSFIKRLKTELKNSDINELAILKIIKLVKDANE